MKATHDHLCNDLNNQNLFAIIELFCIKFVFVIQNNYDFCM